MSVRKFSLFAIYIIRIINALICLNELLINLMRLCASLPLNTEAVAL